MGELGWKAVTNIVGNFKLATLAVGPISVEMVPLACY